MTRSNTWTTSKNSSRTAKVGVWRENGMSEAEISRLAPTEIAQLRARFDQWRAETRARLSMRSG